MGNSIIELDCTYCGKKFDREAKRYRYEKKIYGNEFKAFCTRKCHIKNNESFVIFNCECCGKETKHNNGLYKKSNKHYCSKSCAAKISNKNRILDYTKKKKITCMCGTIFEINERSSVKLCKICNDVRLENKIKPKTYVSNNCVVCNIWLEPKLTEMGNYSKRTLCEECKKQSDEARNLKLRNAAMQKQYRRSKNEMYFADLCIGKYNNVSVNELFFRSDEGGLWDADVILHDFKIAVLWNGIWHYKKVRKDHSVAQVQARDRIKNAVITKNGYFPYTIKDMGKHNKKFVQEQFDIFVQYIEDKFTIKN